MSGAEDVARRRRAPGVRARLLLAFAAITAIAVLAAAAALHAFGEVGERLERVDALAPVTLSALELARSAERIIAVAPALLATVERARRDALRDALAAELERVGATLRALDDAAGDALPLAPLEPLVSRLGASLSDLDASVERRLALAERLAAARRELFETNAELGRLLAPWLAVTDEEIAALAVPGARSGATAHDEAVGQLAALLDRQRLIERARQRFSDAAETLGEASGTDRDERIAVLDFRVGVALRELAATAEELEPRLRPLFLERLARLRALAEGARSIPGVRTRELAALREGERHLTETATLSARLGVEVDRLGGAAKEDISAVIGDALAVQRRSTVTLCALVGLSLLASVLIVWLYVGRRVARRLDALGDAMLAIARGELGTPVETRGRDEIAAMGRAVEVFRRNTAERDALLAQRAQAAERLEREVARRTAELESANAFKTRFLAAASHDLRQPLHALNLFVEQLRDAPDPAVRASLEARVEASIASLNDLFDALLDMARLEAGVLEPRPTAFPLERLLRRLEMTFGSVAGAKGLRLRIVSSALWVRSDFVLLERILLNLVANAVRHTERGGVVIGCRRRGARVRLDVCDSGVGVPEERRQEIFREFRQLAPRETARTEGLGLGLAIVDGLARLLDHPIELDSCPGRGSRFSISVPRTVAEGAIAATPAGPSLADPLPGRVIVVIDDDEAVLESMRGTLEKWGCTVLAAASTAAAIDALAARGAHPDLIVSDCRLGADATGIDAIARVRAAAGDGAVPALLISGDTAPERLREASASGHRLLHKPLTPMALRAMLNRLLVTGRTAAAATREPNDGATAPARAAPRAAPRPR